MDIIEYADEVTDIGKACQIYVDGNPHLFMGSEQRGHTGIMEEILSRNDIPFESQQLRGDNSGPAPKGDRYELVGASWANVYPNKISLKMYGSAYRLSANKEHAKAINELVDI